MADIIGTSDSDTLIRTAADDEILGQQGDDSIDGAAGNDVLEGGAGDDTIAGKGGGDLIYGDYGDALADRGLPTFDHAISNIVLYLQTDGGIIKVKIENLRTATTRYSTLTTWPSMLSSRRTIPVPSWSPLRSSWVTTNPVWGRARASFSSRASSSS